MEVSIREVLLYCDENGKHHLKEEEKLRRAKEKLQQTQEKKRKKSEQHVSRRLSGNCPKK